MKTIEELKQEVYAHGLNDEIREVFLGVLEDANVASLSEPERALYEAKLKRYRDNRACLDYAIEDGILQGIEKGREEGKAEEKIEIARLMKAEGIETAIIARCTGLPVEEIGKI